MLECVIPLLRDHYDVTVEYGWSKSIGIYAADIIYQLTGMPGSDCVDGQRYLWHNHNNYNNLWSPRLIDTTKRKMQNRPVTLIYQSKQSESFFQSIGDSVYFPACINIQKLPTTTTKNGKWIYYGNLRTIGGEAAKAQALTNLTAHMPNVDVLSEGLLNGVGKNGTTTRYTVQECLDIVANYSYGIGSGRCLLEMLGMGLKCICVGFYYGGPILNAADFEKHWAYNCNGSQSTSISIQRDIQAITRSSYTIDPALIDIRQYVPKLIEQFNRSI